MYIHHWRFQSDEKHTKSVLLINGHFQCFLLEDGPREKKVYGETRIPAGVRRITLRTEGGMHEKYKNRFGSWHKGMLWIRDVEEFEYIYLHIGNTPEETLGCPLTGFKVDADSQNIEQSTAAYKHIYPKIAQAILDGEEVWIETCDILQGDKK